MELLKIKCKTRSKLSEIVLNNSNLGYNQIQKIIRNKDIKVNGKRIGQDVKTNAGDEVEVYFVTQNLKVIFEDENIIIVNKPTGIETVADENSLKQNVEKYLKRECFAVHRLDRNTQGIVVFAKNIKAKECLDLAFKNRTLSKYYLALVFGLPPKNEDIMIAYLNKDEKNNIVKISEVQQKDYVIIKTAYKIIKKYDKFALLEVELLTGRTHQIRAHLAHIGCPIVGDEKYGNNVENKKLKKRYQCLCAYKLKFNFIKDDYLCYLNDKVFEIKKEEIDFCKIM